ncbi:MAG: FKBP-type peptidyl-prolyl cis-trans isomerase [Candidatus Zixiibacteriota bacterium]
MKRAELGSTVKVHYTGKLEDGTLFDSTRGKEPFELTLGNGATVPGFEIGIVGMAVGEVKVIKVPYEDGFGPRNKDFKEDIKRSALPKELNIKIGTQLKVPHIDGSFFRATVIAFSSEIVTLDTNHPLAGKNLTFEVEMVEIVK